MDCYARWYNHLCGLRKKKHTYTAELTRSFEAGKLHFEIIEELPPDCTRKQLYEREQYWMNKFPKRINKSKYVTLKGYVLSDEARMKISKAHTGVPLSAEHRASIVRARTGVHPSNVTRIKISQTLKGKRLGYKHSSEAIEKMRAKRALQSPPTLGQTRTAETRKKMSDARAAYWVRRKALTLPES